MVDQGEEVHFTFNGKPIIAKPGQTIAGALHEAGITVLSRSFKYHRPRGLFCVSGRCPNCLSNVDGEPDVRICTREVSDHCNVKSQNHWPSLRFDLLNLFDKLHRFMPVGFYYKTMYKPRWIWPLVEKVIRRIAGLGRINLKSGHSGDYEKQNRFTQVAVVGGGWSGLHAAITAAESGASVILIDDQTTLGGHMRHDSLLADQSLSDLINQALEHPLIEVINQATIFGCYEDGYLGIHQKQRLIRLRAEQIIVATGGWERNYVYENNDLPGNLLASGAQRLIHLDQVSLKGRAIIVTDNPQGYRVAQDLQAMGTKVDAIVDLNAQPSADHGDFKVLCNRSIRSAHGKSHVRSVNLETREGMPAETLQCEWVIQAVGFHPDLALLAQAGCQIQYSERVDHPVVKRYADRMNSAGSVNGFQDPALCLLDAKIAGLSAAFAIHPDKTCLEDQLDLLTIELKEQSNQEQSQDESNRDSTLYHYVSTSVAKKKFVCLCEDVTEKDLNDAVEEGYSNIETLKRYSTISMGPCQGKMCHAASVAICARQNCMSLTETGMTTARPPVQPVPLGVLAGKANQFNLIRRTALHHLHHEAGAHFQNVGTWKRPEHYGNPSEEYAAVRNAVGLIDVSTLGKLDLRGKDVVEFLELLYPSRFKKLSVGKVQYGVLCDEAGILLDDGMVCRLAEDHFYLSTSTSNVESVDSRIRWWLTCRPDLDVRLTNMTTAIAAMNLAGPRSREVLSKLTDDDLSAESIPFPSISKMTIAGIRVIVLRIGFVGELAFELHVPTQYARHLWKAIMSAGDSLGIRPFGTEVQRRLRLEKKYLLPGHDTDALTTPYDAGLDWTIALDKQDFIGRAKLQKAQQRSLNQSLVGFSIEGKNVPRESSLVLQDGKMVGRVTSAEFSPVTEKTIGLAWVPAAQADEGSQLTIQIEKEFVKAKVQQEAFYDPENKRMKS